MKDCRFEYTERYQKAAKMFDCLRYVFTTLLLLILINNLFIKMVNPDTALNAMFWSTSIMALITGVLNIYKVHAISLPSIDFTLRYGDFNKEDPLQKKVVSDAIEFATLWASFALQREISKIIRSAIFELIFGTLLILCLIF